MLNILNIINKIINKYYLAKNFYIVSQFLALYLEIFETNIFYYKKIINSNVFPRENNFDLINNILKHKKVNAFLLTRQTNTVFQNIKVKRKGYFMLTFYKVHIYLFINKKLFYL